eukprot:3225210-Heterocapsa_arctica.AAC.1
MTNGIGKHPKPSSPLSRAPFQFLSHDGLKIDHPGSKEAQELISVIKEEGNLIWMEKGSKETIIVTIWVSNTRPECTLDVLVELRGDVYAITWKFISQDTFMIRTTGTLDMRLLIAYFKEREVEIHQEPHHRPLCARRLIDTSITGLRADGRIGGKVQQTWAISQAPHEMRTFQIVVHKLTTTRVLNLIMKELQVSLQHVEIRNANVRTKQGYESPAHVIQTVDPGTIQRLADAI